MYWQFSLIFKMTFRVPIKQWTASNVYQNSTYPICYICHYWLYLLQEYTGSNTYGVTTIIWLSFVLWLHTPDDARDQITTFLRLPSTLSAREPHCCWRWGRCWWWWGKGQWKRLFYSLRNTIFVLKRIPKDLFGSKQIAEEPFFLGGRQIKNICIIYSVRK